MGLTERLQLTLQFTNLAVSNVVFTRSEIPFRVPRGSVGRIIRGELLLSFGTTVGATASRHAFAGIRRGVSTPAGNPNNPSNPNTQVVRLNLMMPTMVGNIAIGTPNNQFVALDASKSSRQFTRDPHEQAEIRNTGGRGSRGEGWSVISWGGVGTTNITFWVALEIEIEYEPSKPTKNMSRAQKSLLVAQ